MLFVFIVLLIAVFGRLGYFAIRLAWGLVRIVGSVVLLPLALVGLVVGGLLRLALPILVIIGIISLLTVPGRA